MFSKENIRTALIILAIIVGLIVMSVRQPVVDESDSIKDIKDAMARIEKRQLRDSINKHKVDSLFLELLKRDSIIFNYNNQLTNIYDQLHQTIDNIMVLSDDQLIQFYSNQLPKDTNH